MCALTRAALLALALALAPSSCASDAAPGDAGGARCGPAEATVERVIDGDTIVLTSGERVRYLLLDAPETTLGHDDCYGSNATRFNTDLVAGKRIALAYDVQCTDAYDRLLAYITVAADADGPAAAEPIDVNASLVGRGYACVLHIPPNGAARLAQFEDLEARARTDRLGVWSCDPLPPACR